MKSSHYACPTTRLRRRPPQHPHSHSTLCNAFDCNEREQLTPSPPGGVDATRLPAVVQYQGYGGGRGLAHEAVLWTLAGYAHLVINTRGQGAAGRPATCPTRRLLAGSARFDARHPRPAGVNDAVRAAEAIREHEAVDATRLPSPAAVRATASRSRSRRSSRTSPRACPTSRSSAPSSGRSRSPRASRTASSRATSKCTATSASGSSRRCPTSTASRSRGACARLCRVDGPDLPAVDRLRGVQRLRGREADGGLPVQRPRGRRSVPPGRADDVPTLALVASLRAARVRGAGSASDRGRTNGPPGRSAPCSRPRAAP